MSNETWHDAKRLNQEGLCAHYGKIQLFQVALYLVEIVFLYEISQGSENELCKQFCFLCTGYPCCAYSTNHIFF